MKNNYNPYTVPENFFEQNCLMAVSKFRKRRRIIRGVIAGVAVSIITLTLPVVVTQISGRKAQEQEIASGTLARMYEYDIFLQVNF